MSSVETKPSKTAELVAAARAVHTRHDKPVLLNDPYAVNLCGHVWRTIAKSSLLTWFIRNFVKRRQATLVHFLVIRAIYGERQLESAVKRGVRQYVIIGAGYDSFAFRRPDLTKDLAVFEVDAPTTQQEKLRRMERAGINKPDSVRYVAADLNRETLDAALNRSGFDANLPAFFSWFGVTYYLPDDTVAKTLDLVVQKMAAGSSISFDYVCTLNEVADEYKELRTFMADFVASRGEPWISAMNPNTIQSNLRGQGFSDIHHLQPGRVAEELAPNHPTVKCPPIMGLCTATTGN